jgi:glycosyltransferase involved in cell wall biosynthesis
MSLPDGLITELGALPPAPERPIRFLCVGRLLDWKGFHLAVKAFALAAIPDSELWVVGDGPAKARLAKLARELGVEDRVRFLGKLTHRAALQTYGKAHALVHPSLHDSGSWVATESMAAGRPVVCLNLGGPGVIVSSESGFRVEAREPHQAIDDIARAMRTLAEDPALRRTMGEAGRRRVDSEFRWAVRGRRISEALEAAVRR